MDDKQMESIPFPLRTGTGFEARQRSEIHDDRIGTIEGLVPRIMIAYNAHP